MLNQQPIGIGPGSLEVTRGRPQHLLYCPRPEDPSNGFPRRFLYASLDLQPPVSPVVVILDTHKAVALPILK